MFCFFSSEITLFAIANNVISEEKKQNIAAFLPKNKFLFLEEEYKQNQQLPEKLQMILFVQPLCFSMIQNDEQSLLLII